MVSTSAATQANAASPRFFNDLNRLLAGDLSRFQAGLAGPTDPRPGLRADELLDRPSVAAIIARYDAKFGKTDPRAIMSMWASAYFTDAIPPLLTANVLLDRAPKLEIDQVTFIMAPSLRIQAVKIKPDLLPIGDADDRFDSLVFGHLAPLIDLVAQRGGITRRVLWSNAGNVFEAFLRKLRNTTTERPGFAQANRLLASPIWRVGEQNPLFQPVRYPQGRRIRRVCCMRYLIPREKVCGVCPLAVDNPIRGREAGPER